MTTQNNEEMTTQIEQNENPPKVSDTCKTALLAVMLARPEGVTLTEMAQQLGWKENSVRSAMSNLVSKQVGAKLISEKADGVRRYRLIAMTKTVGDDSSETVQ